MDREQTNVKDIIIKQVEIKKDIHNKKYNNKSRFIAKYTVTL